MKCIFSFSVALVIFTSFSREFKLLTFSVIGFTEMELFGIEVIGWHSQNWRSVCLSFSLFKSTNIYVCMNVKCFFILNYNLMDLTFNVKLRNCQNRFFNVIPWYWKFENIFAFFHQKTCIKLFLFLQHLHVNTCVNFIFMYSMKW